MPYKDKEKQKEAVRKAVNKKRGNVIPCNTIEQKGITKVETVIPDVIPIDDYPPIVHYLADDTKREKLRRISDSLSNHNVSELVRFGCFGPTFDKVGEILTAFPVNKRLYDSCYGV